MCEYILYSVYCIVLPASCTFSTALVISAFKASVSSADTEVATGTTVNRHKTQSKQPLIAVHCREVQGAICSICHRSKPMMLIFLPKITELGMEDAFWPVSWATALAAKASVARVTMSSVVTVTMLNSLSEVDAPAHPSAPSSVLPSANTSRFMPALPWWTVLTWERRLSTRLNPLPHLSHRKGFSPERARRRKENNWRVEGESCWVLLDVENK